MQTVAALLIIGVDYKSAVNMDFREAEILMEEWTKLKQCDLRP